LAIYVSDSSSSSGGGISRVGDDSVGDSTIIAVTGGSGKPFAAKSKRRQLIRSAPSSKARPGFLSAKFKILKMKMMEKNKSAGASANPKPFAFGLPGHYSEN
jgi:hypothetical protein